MIVPKRLKVGDTIGLVSPASPSDKEDIFSLIYFLKSKGFNVIEGKHLYLKDKYLAGNDNKRAEDINYMFKSKEVDAILCIRGGYGSPRILDFIDYENIRSNPKIFIGYSDITALSIGINQKSKLVTYHGPMGVSNLIKNVDDITLKSIYKVLMENGKGNILKNPKNKKLKIIEEGFCEGKVVGGNLSLVTSLLGTDYEIDTKDKILLLEEVEEKPRKIDRMFNQLKLSGKIDDAAGIILGDFNNCVDVDGYDSFSIMEVIKNYFNGIGKPVVFNFQTGHCIPMLTIPLGVQCRLDTKNKEIKILDNTVI